MTEFQVGDTVRVITRAFGDDIHNAVGVVEFTPETYPKWVEYYGVRGTGCTPSLPAVDYPNAFPFKEEELEFVHRFQIGDRVEARLGGGFPVTGTVVGYNPEYWLGADPGLYLYVDRDNGPSNHPYYPEELTKIGEVSE